MIPRAPIAPPPRLTVSIHAGLPSASLEDSEAGLESSPLLPYASSSSSSRT